MEQNRKTKPFWQRLTGPRPSAKVAAPKVATTSGPTGQAGLPRSPLLVETTIRLFSERDVEPFYAVATAALSVVIFTASIAGYCVLLAAVAAIFF